MEEMLIEILHLTSKRLQDSKQILKTTKEIKRYIDEEKTDSLTKSIELRQRWMEQSDKTEGKINKNIYELYRKFNMESLDQIDENLYPEVKEIFKNNSQARDLYKKAYDLEKQNQSKIKGLLGEYKGKIIDIQQGKHAHHTYGKQATGQSLLLNKVK